MKPDGNGKCLVCRSLWVVPEPSITSVTGGVHHGGTVQFSSEPQPPWRGQRVQRGGGSIFFHDFGHIFGFPISTLSKYTSRVKSSFNYKGRGNFGWGLFRSGKCCSGKFRRGH